MKMWEKKFGRCPHLTISKFVSWISGCPFLLIIGCISSLVLNKESLIKQCIYTCSNYKMPRSWNKIGNQAQQLIRKANTMLAFIARVLEYQSMEILRQWSVSLMKEHLKYHLFWRQLSEGSLAWLPRWFPRDSKTKNVVLYVGGNLGLISE